MKDIIEQVLKIENDTKALDKILEDEVKSSNEKNLKELSDLEDDYHSRMKKQSEMEFKKIEESRDAELQVLKTENMEKLKAIESVYQARVQELLDDAFLSFVVGKSGGSE